MCHPVGFWTVFDQNRPDGIEFSIRRRVWQEKEKAELRATVKERGKTLSVLCPVSSFTDPIQLYPDDGSDHGI